MGRCLYLRSFFLLHFCQSVMQPAAPSKLAITPEWTSGGVHLKCSFSASSNNSSSSLGHVVAWSRASPQGEREELKRETTIQTWALIELDGFNLRLGDKVKPHFIKRQNQRSQSFLWRIFWMNVFLSDLLLRLQLLFGLSGCPRCFSGKSRILCWDSGTFLPFSFVDITFGFWHFFRVSRLSRRRYLAIFSNFYRCSGPFLNVKHGCNVLFFLSRHDTFCIFNAF